MNHWPSSHHGRRRWWLASLIVLVLVCLATQTPLASAPCQSDGRYAMGTVLEITLCNAQRTPPTFDDLFTQVTSLEGQLTTFSPSSVVSRLNANAGHGPMAVSPAVHEILTLSLRYWRQTRGTFDVTVGPIVTMWRQASDSNTPPSEKAFQRARARVGGHLVRFSPDEQVTLARTGMRLDLGGIGKGY